MKSSEYADLTWMEPKSWTNANRSSVQLVVIHTTEGSARGTAAEDGAAYDQRRTDGTSTHYFHDSNSTIQCVHSADQAHAARAQGNKRGIQHELCTKAGSANWSDAYHTDMLHNAARQCARDARKWGIPVKKLSSSQVAAGVRGFCGHVEITDAFPQDGGTHTDPGKNFPWDRFLDMVNDEMEDGVSEAEVTSALNKFFKVSEQDSGLPESKIGHDASVQGVPNTIDGGTTYLYRLVGRIGTELMATKKLVADLAGKDFTDEAAISASVVTGVLEGLAGAEGAAETIADAVMAALPVDLAQQVVDEMAARLAPADEPAP